MAKARMRTRMMCLGCGIGSTFGEVLAYQFGICPYALKTSPRRSRYGASITPPKDRGLKTKGGGKGGK